MRDWQFQITGFASDRFERQTPAADKILVQTVHADESSAYVEIEAWRARMKRGEVSHVQLLDLRPGNKLTNLRVTATTRIPWSHLK